MTQKQKGYVGLGVMLVLAAGTVLGSDPLYKAIDKIGVEKVDYTPGTYVGTAEGFGGEVVATVAISGSGIESVELKGDGETPALGGAAMEQLAPAFVEAGSAKVDAVSGATITSNAAMEAVGQALDQAAGKIPVIEVTEAAETEAETEEVTEAAETEAETEEETKEETEAAEKVSYIPGTYEGTAEGFGGEVKAVVTITEDGIETVELTGDDETPELGGEALKKLAPAFVEAQSADVDAVSGCTLTSGGAVKAVQAALDQAAGGTDAEAGDGTEVDTAADGTAYKPGTYEGTGKGFGGEIKAVVTVTEAGIESVKLTGDDETPELGGEALEKLEDLFVETQSADVDAVSGCTLTSGGAMDAVQAALDQAK